MFVDEANYLHCNAYVQFIEYNDSYSDTSGSLRQFKRDDVPADNADLSINNSQSFKYKSALVAKRENAVDGNNFITNTKIVVLLKYLNNFRISLEMPLINCKVHLELKWIEDCILSSAGNSAKFTITDAKLHVPIVTLSTKDNVNLTKQLRERLKKICLLEQLSNKACKGNRKRKIIYINYLMHHFKELEDYLFLIMLFLQVLQMMKPT